ncbi:MAG: DUF4743 domain-containing protein [Pseudomonadota bacterium]
MPPSLSDQVIAFLHSEPRFEPVNELRLHIDGRALGWVRPRVAEALCQLDRQRIRVNTRDLYLSAGNDCASRSQALQAWAMALRKQGVLANWRDEAMQLNQPEGVFLIIERAAFRTFGLCTPSVHLNGWVAMPDGVQLWVAERSAHKFVDPGKLDNLVGGGVAAGEPLALALTREAWEEAGLHFRRAPRPISTLHIHRRIQEGVQEEQIAVHDTWLPAHFLPTNQDGEVADARLMPLPAVLAMLLDRHFTWDAGLVVLDGLLRQRYFGADGALIEQTLAALGYRN